MSVLTPGDSKYFQLDTIPYQRGVWVNFDDAGFRIEIRASRNDNAPLLNWTLYSNLIDGTTGNPFASYAALKLFVIAYIFAKTGELTSVTFVIKDAPVGNQKPSGPTLQDNSLKGVTPLDFLIVNDVAYQWQQDGATFDSEAGEFDFSASQSGNLTDSTIITIPYSE